MIDKFHAILVLFCTLVLLAFLSVWSGTVRVFSKVSQRDSASFSIRWKRITYKILLVLIATCLVGVMLMVLPYLSGPTGTVAGQPDDAPNGTPSDEIATFDPGSGTIDVSDRDWIYVDIEGASGEDSSDYPNGGGEGAHVTGWINVSNIDSLEYVVASSGSTAGLNNGEYGEFSAANGAGSTGVAYDGTVLLEAGGGGGASSDDGNNLPGAGGGEAGNGGAAGTAESPPGGDGSLYAGNRSLYPEQIDTSAGDGAITVYEPYTDTALIESYSPENNDEVQDNTIELTATVPNEKFIYPWASDVNVSFYDTNDDTLLHSEIVSQETTITYSWETNGGIQTYNVTANATNGDSYSSDEIRIVSSGATSVRSEQTGELVESEVTTTLFGENGAIYERNTSDGLLDYSDIPNQAYTIQVSSDNRYTRTRYVSSLDDLSTLFILNDSVETITAQFTLEDTTGEYDSDSILIIGRPIDTGNGTMYRTIVADQFGTEGLSTELEQDRRYRVTIRNEGGRTQVLGPYRGTISETVTITPGSGTIEIESEGTWSAGATQVGDTIRVAYNDPIGATDSVSISIHERGNQSNALIANDTFVSPSNLSAEYSVPEQYNGSNWIVQLTVDRDGESTTITYVVGPQQTIVPANLDPMWQQAFGVVILLTFGLAFTTLNRAAGAIALACVGGLLWWIGWLAGATAGVAVVAYLFIAIAYGIFTKTVR